jgi:GMP synthase PP-ATPase subunit
MPSRSGGLPDRMANGAGLRLIEPLRSLYKDEVRGKYQFESSKSSNWR